MKFLILLIFIDLMQLFDGNISKFESFLGDRLTALISRESTLVRTFDPSELLRFYSHPKERVFVFREYRRLLIELLKIQCFARVNQEAIDRLLWRFQRLVPRNKPDGTLQHIEHRWYRLHGSQNMSISIFRDNFLHHIRKFTSWKSFLYDSVLGERPDTTILPYLEGPYLKSDGNSGNSSKSLLLDRVVGVPPEDAAHLASAFKALEEDGSGHVSSLFTRLTAPAHEPPFRKFRDLFAFFVLQRSWRNALMLLEHAASGIIRTLLFDERLNIGYDTVQLVATVHLHDVEAPETGSIISSGSVSRQNLPRIPCGRDVFSRILQLLDPPTAKKLLTMESDEGPMFHLLAKHGLYQWCREALKKMQQIGGESSTLELIFTPDSSKVTPLHYAVAHKHSLVVELFCDWIKEDGDMLQISPYQNILITCLGAAVKLGSISDIHQLLGLVTDINLKSYYEMTALHLASHEGKIEIISLLLGAGADLNSSLHPRGWTPIFEAAVHGNVEAVEYLIKSGADLSVVDYLGWTVEEVAMYRGFFAISELLHVAGDSKSAKVSEALSYVTNPRERGVEIGGAKKQEDITVVVNLGSMQVGRYVPAVQLKDCSSEYRGPNESRLQLEISAAGKTREIRLPILDERTNVPLVFSFSQGTDLCLAFKVCDGRTICGGVAILDSNKLLFGPQRQSLVKEHTVSLLNRDNFNIAGSVVFTYVIVRPFPDLQSTKYRFSGQNASHKGVALVGHRGI
jgi:hypothetical protein